jgi:four helix bundle protein
MREDKLSIQSMDFAVDIINLVKELKSKKENIISNQIGRSGTSIGANIREAHYAHGTADFIAKLQISLKETAETEYWLRLLVLSEYITEQEGSSLLDDCLEIKRILVSTLNTAKENNK